MLRNLVVWMIAYNGIGAFTGWALDRAAVAEGWISSADSSANQSHQIHHLYVLLAGLGIASCLVSSMLILRAFGIEWGSCEVPNEINCVSVPIGLILDIMLFWTNPAFGGVTVAAICAIILFPIWIAFAMNIRGWAQIPLGLLCLSAGLDPSLGLSNCLGNAILGIMLLVTVNVKYVHDQRLAILLVVMLVMSMSSASSFASGGPLLGTLVLLFDFSMMYVTLLVHRRKRSLPAALKGCKFIRLGYLRKMLHGTQRISRCQDMPPEAFGDVGKAAVLIITSHRWLNRFTCDEVTPDHPCGLRLTMMLNRLRAFYPESVAGAFGGGPFNGIVALVSGMRYGGSDVLLFFDFMGLPQIGMDADGNHIQRTSEEAVLFAEALPAMGALYTMFPVLVLPETIPGTHGYFFSGWCFSEFSSAMLAKKLSTFSEYVVREYVTWLQQQQHEDETSVTDDMLNTIIMKVHSGTLSADSAGNFLGVFRQDLGRKKFFSESDRPTVQGIVDGVLVLRLLSDAVACQNLDKVNEHLAALISKGLQETLNHAVDETLDTLLHKAAQYQSPEIVTALLEAGADRHARNLRGDTPDQWFTLPRFSRSAQLVRLWGSGPETDMYRPIASAGAEMPTV